MPVPKRLGRSGPASSGCPHALLARGPGGLGHRPSASAHIGVQGPPESTEIRPQVCRPVPCPGGFGRPDRPAAWRPTPTPRRYGRLDTRRHSVGSAGRRRDPEEPCSVHLSGGTPGRALPVCRPGRSEPPPRRRLRPRRTERRRSRPCISRLRPPPPTTTAPPWADQGRRPACHRTRTAPTGTRRKVRAAPLRPSARTDTRPHPPRRVRLPPGRRARSHALAR